MATDVIYEKPKLSLWETIKGFWNYVEVYSRGFDKEHVLKHEKKMEADWNKELKDVQNFKKKTANKRLKKRKRLLKGIKSPNIINY